MTLYKLPVSLVQRCWALAFQPVDVINLHLEIQGVENTT